ncbi:putative ANTH domain-containing protein [Lupinus albus]|uniref:Putative ANTH domain-containing protein n=1 Tax=Lupinus albus TaxID=3870 RepID=A0A6A4PQB6_LUPAL|nr:putative ANTH domain-containing protein [Lupinus albus]
MAQRKRVRNFANKLKDKASLIAATFSFKHHLSSIHVHVIRATTHALAATPSESTIAAVLGLGQHQKFPRACIDALMDRLHHTRSATVAMKCLFTLHNVVVKGPITLKDQFSHYPSYGGHNFLNLSTFRDDSDVESVELSSWVRWYAVVIEQCLTVSRIMGHYLHLSLNEQDHTQERNSSFFRLSNADLLYKIEGLILFVEQVSRVPESLHLQRKDLIYEVVKLVREDYRSAQREILWRLEELEKRMKDLDVGELNELVGYLERLEESKEKLVILFVNKIKYNGFWDLVKEVKKKGLEMKKEIEGKWLTVVTTKNTELTRSTNPFLEPGQIVLVPPLSFATGR